MMLRDFARAVSRSCCLGVPLVLFSGCYTVQQGWYQAKLFTKQRGLDEVLAARAESQERLAKLQIVPEVMAFAQHDLGLNTGKSYTKYIALDDTAVTWIVQAAEQRALRLKTWWFPLVGAQPYLGYFVKKDALDYKKKLDHEGYDTVVGGVQAFSLLGYFSDPLYSSMLDGNSFEGVVEVLIHECVHRTLYLPNQTSFNENLADFFSKYATVAFLLNHREIAFNSDSYLARYRQNLAAQRKFKDFLLKTRERLEVFYAAAGEDRALESKVEFLAARAKFFDAISTEYAVYMAGSEKGTSYDGAFRAGRFNNATILGYSLYEARQEPFEAVYAASGRNLKQFLANLKSCVSERFDDEAGLWRLVEHCKGGS